MILGARIRIPVGIGRSFASPLLALALLVTMGACGPAGYIKNVTFNASSSVAAAKSVDAQQWAPYEYTRALQYLHKAREEAANADFQAANRFGRLAHEAAMEAKKLAIARSADPDNEDWKPPPSLRDQGAQTDAKTDAKAKGEPSPDGAKDDDSTAEGDSTAGDDSTTGDDR